MDSSDHSSYASIQRQPPQATESQYGRHDPSEFEDATPPLDEYPIIPAGDTLFTNVPTEDPDEYIEQEHEPVWQLRGGYDMTAHERYEMERRATQFRDTGSTHNKTLQLFNGNLVLDCPVAPRLLNEVPHAQSPERDEFTHMRYSAVTCDPADFRAEGFTLRPLLFGKPRKTELLIAVTMYNEDEVLLGKTIKAVMRNIEYLCHQKSSTVWGKDAWKKVVVCIISDGRSKIDPRSRALLAGMGVFQDGIAKQQVNGRTVTAHLYEYTTQVRIESVDDNQVTLRARGTVCQIVFCLKEKPERKVNSHRWLFQAFGDILHPNICILLDAGTVPERDAFHSLWYAFRRDPASGCAVGEYRARSRSLLVNPLVAMQHFEYKMKNMLDRPLASLFGQHFEESGALSAYRYVALLSDRQGNGPLQRYFLTDITAARHETSLFRTNMALAEDRILSFELVSKKDSPWKLLYVASALAEVEVPTYLDELLVQRRRKLNGNTFASLYALAHFTRFLATAHSIPRKIGLTIQFAYQAVSMCLSWFSPGLFFLTFHIITVTLSDEEFYGKTGHVLSELFESLYLLNLFFSLILALANSPRQSRKLYTSISYMWTLIMIYMVFAMITVIVNISKIRDKFGHVTVSTLFQTQLFWSLVVPILATYVVWLIVSVLFLSPWHMVTSFVQYILFLPTSVNLVSVYAFCNVHDVQWGTRDDRPTRLPNVAQLPSGAVVIPTIDINLDEQYDAMLALLKEQRPLYISSITEDVGAYYRTFRTLLVFSWVLSNAILVLVIFNVPGMNKIKFGPSVQVTQGSIIFLAIVFWRIAGDALFKLAGVLIYLIWNHY